MHYCCAHRDQGKYKDAIRLLREVLEIREKCYGKNHQIVRSTTITICYHCLYTGCIYTEQSVGTVWKDGAIQNWASQYVDEH